MPVYEEEIIRAHRKGPNVQKNLAPRYPSDSEDDDHYQPRQRSRDARLPRSRSPSHRVSFARQSSRSSRSPIPPRRQTTYEKDDRYRHYSSDSDSDSPRHHSSRRRSSTRGGNLDVIPYNNSRTVSRNDRSASHSEYRDGDRNKHHDDSSSSESSSDSSEDEHERKKARNKKRIYKTLACMTTIGTCNNIYQNTKAYEARKKAVREGQLSAAEAKRQRNKNIVQDVMALGVAAVCINNAKKGWKKVESLP